MKSRDEIMLGLTRCLSRGQEGHCDKCPYYDISVGSCQEVLRDETNSLIQQLEAKVARWISVEERLPDGEVLAANFAPGTYGYKENIIGYVYVVKGFEPDYVKGKCYASNDFEILNNVTHWMPLPKQHEE